MLVKYMFRAVPSPSVLVEVTEQHSSSSLGEILDLATVLAGVIATGYLFVKFIKYLINLSIKNEQSTPNELELCFTDNQMRDILSHIPDFEDFFVNGIPLSLVLKYILMFPENLLLDNPR